MAQNTPNYMDDPNQDIYQMLAQRNMANRSYGGGGGGGGNEIDIMSARDAFDQLAEGRADNRSLRNRALDAMSRRAERRADIEAQGATMDLNKQFMEDIAKRKMDLLIQEQELNLKMARAEMEDDPEMLNRKNELQRQRADIEARQLAASAEMAKRDATHGKDFAQRIGELNTYKTALETWDSKHKGSLNAEGTISSLLNDPSKYGNVANWDRLGADTIVESIGEGLIEKFYSGDKVKDVETARKLGVSEGAMPERFGSMLAAAARYGGKEGGLLSYMDQSAGEGSFRESQVQHQLRMYGGETYQKDADAFSNDLLSDIVVKGLSNSGMDLNHDGARIAVNKVIGILNDATRSTSTNHEDVSKSVMEAMRPAAQAIFGPTEGEKALPKLVQAMQNSLSEAQSIASKYGSEVMGAGGVIGFENIQKAAVAHALKRSGALSMALKTAVNGKVLTADQVAMALGETGGHLQDASTGKLDYGLINLDAGTEEGRVIRQALGSKQVAELEELIKARKARSQGQEAATAQLKDLENVFSREIPALELKRKVSANERKQALLAAVRKSQR